MKEIKKICFVTAGCYPVPNVKGGAIEHLITLLCQCNEEKQNFDFTVITHSNANAQILQNNYTHTRFINIDTLGEFVYRMIWKVRGLLRYFSSRSFCTLHIYEHRVNKYLTRNATEFDLIIAEGCDPALLTSIARKHGKEKICLHLHAAMKANKQTDATYGHLFAVSEYVRKNYLSTSTLPHYQSAILFNGINLAGFQKSLSHEEKAQYRTRLGFTTDDFILIFCGRIIPEKGLKELIQTVLSITNKPIKLLIVGTSNFASGDKGGYPQEVKELASQHSDQIKFTGFVDNKQLYKYYKTADIGVVPSICEDACPLVLPEMLSCGLPTIATLSGGIPEIGTKDTTLFVDKDKDIILNIRKAIMQLYENPALRNQMRQAALKRSEKFDKATFYESFCGLINQ